MSEIAAILARAREAANSSGNSGYGGYDLEEHSSFNKIGCNESVPTEGVVVGTVGTEGGVVPAVPAATTPMGTGGSERGAEENQSVTSHVPTVPTVPTRFDKAPDRQRAIGPEIVLVGIERERRALAEIGVIGPEAEVRALEITRAKLHNAHDLAERQTHDGRCHACGAPLDDTRPVVAVMTGRPKSPLWMHSGACHDEHRQRVTAKVDAIVAAATSPPETEEAR